MSDNNPPIPPVVVHRKSKHKQEKLRLPTPPPDPVDDTKQDSDFLEYLDSLQKSSQHGFGRSVSIFAPAIAAENAFDHLDKLYKLMDQMLMLREQNAKLHRRIRDLEHLSNLQKIEKHLDAFPVDDDLLDQEKDAALAETLFENIFTGTKRDSKIRPFGPPKLRHSLLRKQRNRSSSADKISPLDTDRLFVYNKSRRTSEIQNEDPGKSSKVSKWTKVKAAFKWEKASPTVGDAKSQDSGLGGMLPVNLEVARYLRVPSTSDDIGPSPTDSGAAEISTPGTMSYASSAEDLQKKEHKSPWNDFHSSDEEHHPYFNNEYIPYTKEVSSNSFKDNRNKSHRTPWAKMKDIIQTRNSFKKRNRLSARSDEMPAYEHLGSENEEVFEEDDKSRIEQPSSDNLESPLPPEIIARYHQVLAQDDLVDIASGNRRISKWSRVKKAFLTRNDISRSNVEISKSKSESDCRQIQEEIQQNYKQLQQKISLEFQDKMQEWEKSKLSPGSAIPSTSTNYLLEENQDPAFLKKMEEWKKIKLQPTTKTPTIQLQSEENLPPEFRKKLQEWQKIKKSSGKDDNARKKLGDRPKWKSVNRSEEVHLDYPPLSEEFLKKLEEWKQIKASGGPTVDFDARKSAKENKTPSPRMVRKDSPSKHKKGKEGHDKELQWFEKELNKIEKEKQRLERERQKFLEREERLTKLRRSIVGGNKKEVLVHTRSGFHRFEGISRKFTQKLYEWEKAQGIAPEESTFALLTSCYAPEPTQEGSKREPTVQTLSRSKSADSLVTSALSLTCPLMSHQPSSLSLNDVEHLEKEYLVDSKSSSLNYLCQENDEDEPEALIVEVEDIIEETAAPLQTAYLEIKQTPVYQREAIKSMCEGEAVLAPKVRRIQSTRAQTNYNLIEDCISTIKLMSEVEADILRREREINLTFENSKIEEKQKVIQLYYDKQKANSSRLSDQILSLQEANSKVTSNISEEGNYNRLNELLEEAQDLSSELSQMTETIHGYVNRRCLSEFNSKERGYVIEYLKQLNAKILELRRLLSYICAVSDGTAPDHKKIKEKKKIKPSSSKDETVKAVKEETGKFIKSDKCNSPSHGAIKKRIKYRQKSMENRLQDESDEDEDVSAERRLKKHKRLTRVRSVSESYSTQSEKECLSAEIDLNVVEKVVVPTEPNYVSYSDAASPSTESPVTVFVKTTRKLFTPIAEKAFSFDKPSTSTANTNISVKEVEPKTEETDPEAKLEEEAKETRIISVSHLPPLPASPTPQRKLSKDISPSIRIMLARYNQKIIEQDTPLPCSGGSSGSNSPLPWRSPTSERRVKAQMEKYQEEVKKLSPLLGGRRDVMKSASAGVLNLGKKQITVLKKDPVPNEDVPKLSLIAKSSSAGLISAKDTNQNVQKSSAEIERRASSLKYPSSQMTVHESKEMRTKKLQKAKEEFLKSGSISVPGHFSNPQEEPLKFPDRNRLSQISMGSESSYDYSAFEGALMKSASAGMINVDPDTYRKIDPEVHKEGYVSLPRTTKSISGILGGKFGFANIASKFRKMKMRRGAKDPNKMNAVSTLCRQSLVVDINKRELQNQTEDRKEST